MTRLGACCLALFVAASPATAARGAASPAGAAPAAQAERAADEAFARDDYVTAERLYREAVTPSAGSYHALSRLALLLTWRERYPEAIGFYKRAIALEPARLEARRGLATTYTWKDDYAAALSLHRELLAERPGDEGITFEMAQAQAWSGDTPAAERTLHKMVGKNPRHVKARLLLAQVHRWQGELVEAEKIQRSVLADDPSNLEALAGLGETLTSQQRYEEALTVYGRALAVDPRHRASLEGRARAYHWQGRAPEALEAVRQALELYPDARDARRLGRDIGGALRPTLQLFGGTTQDTDDNDLATWGATYTHHLGGRGHLGFSYTHAQTDARAADPAMGPAVSVTPVAKYDTLRATGGVRFSRFLSLYGEAGGERTSFPFSDPVEGHSNERKSHGAGSVTLEVAGAEWFTFVASAFQERLVGTTQAFMNDVGIRAGTLTAVFRPHASVRLRLTGQKAAFTDDEDVDVDAAFQVSDDAGGDHDRGRDLATGSVTWRLPIRRPRLTLSYNVRWMSYDENLDASKVPIRHGYFDPERYVSNLLGVDLSDTFGPHVYWGAGADRGRQEIDAAGEADPGEEDDVRDDVLGYRLLAGFNIGQSLALEAYFSRTDHALQAAAGFRSTDAGIRLRLRFGSTLGPAAPERGRARAAGDPPRRQTKGEAT